MTHSNDESQSTPRLLYSIDLLAETWEDKYAASGLVIQIHDLRGGGVLSPVMIHGEDVKPVREAIAAAVRAHLVSRQHSLRRELGEVARVLGASGLVDAAETRDIQLEDDMDEESYNSVGRPQNIEVSTSRTDRPVISVEDFIQQCEAQADQYPDLSEDAEEAAGKEE